MTYSTFKFIDNENVQVLRKPLQVNDRVVLSVDVEAPNRSVLQPQKSSNPFNSRLGRDLSRRRPSMDELKRLLIERRANMIGVSNKSENNLKANYEEQGVELFEDDSQVELDIDLQEMHTMNKASDTKSNESDIIKKINKQSDVEDSYVSVVPKDNVYRLPVSERGDPSQQVQNKQSQSDSQVQHQSDFHTSDQPSHKQQTLLQSNRPAADGTASKKSIKHSSKKKSKIKSEPPTLPKDYPLFESPYPPPVIDGHKCR